VLISGGVGITPTLAMSEAALLAGDREVVFIHYARNAEVQAFSATLSQWEREYPQFRKYIVLEDGTDDVVAGRPSLAHLKHWIPAQSHAYFLGPKPFMRAIHQVLKTLGVPEENRRYEFFGPAEALQ
jgi:nitric oxide dioxygenase